MNQTYPKAGAGIPLPLLLTVLFYLATIASAAAEEPCGWKAFIFNPPTARDTLPPLANAFPPVTGDYRGIRISDLLLIFQDRYNIRFYFEPDLMPDYEVYLQYNNVPFFDALERLLSGTNLFFSRLDRGVIILAPLARMNKAYAEQLVVDWEAGRYQWPGSSIQQELSLRFGAPEEGGKGPFRFRGIIVDKDSRQPVVGATLIENKTYQGTTTDAEGTFELTLPAGSHQLDIRYIGYRQLNLDLKLYAPGEAEIKLEVSPFNLDEVIIKARADDSNVRQTEIGVENLEVKTIRELPTFLGEADVIRSLETLAGVSTVGEGATGLNVRGGNIDQNLVLQDGVPLFNSSHALGFFSVFNPDVISDVALYKGSIPAQYGGRLSAVVDVQVRDGDFRQFTGRGGVGLANSRLSIEGPLVRDRTSFIAGGRLSYSDWMLRLVDNPDVRTSSVGFHDLTARLSHKFSDENRLSLTYFRTFDRFRYGRNFGFQWRNESLSLAWNYIFNERLSSGFRAVAGTYDSQQFEELGPDAAELSNQMDFLVLKENIFYQPRPELKINTGLEWTRYDPRPERRGPYGDQSVVLPLSIPKDRGDEWAAYLNAELNLTDRLSVSAGLRYSHFRQLGPRDVFNYDPERPRLPGNETDTTSYGPGQLVTSYGGPEPRFSLKYQLGPTSSVKFGYSFLRQYIHLISNTAAATPVDLWQVSTEHIPPQRAHSLSIGYFHNFRKNLWQLSLEGYYKDMRNLVTFKEVPDLVLNPQLETQLLTALGRAYGGEFTIKKTSGKWSGQLSYTYARSLLQAQADFSFEAVNQGHWFPANFDQPHQIYLVLKREINPVHSYTFQFTYRTGRPFTTPTANYEIDAVLITQFSDRNEGRVRDYHRLDFSYSVDNTERKDKGFRTSFTFSLYNVYLRRNPFTIFYQRNERNQQAAYQLSVLGTIFPAFSLNFVF